MTKDDEMLDEKEVAKMLGVSVPTLQRWRRQGEGPPWHRFVRLVRYRRSEVERFIEESRR